jgi:hypothetical protein
MYNSGYARCVSSDIRQRHSKLTILLNSAHIFCRALCHSASPWGRISMSPIGEGVSDLRDDVGLDGVEIGGVVGPGWWDL